MKRTKADLHFMRLALEQASRALDHDDVPIGAVAVKAGEVIASAHNERELRGDPTAHAEVLALREASRVLGTWRLNGVGVYVTLEPCPMCAGAMVAGRVKRLVYGAADKKAGGAWSLYNIAQDRRLNHRCQVASGVLAGESSALLLEFFRTKRRRPINL
ncbi:MAG: tRNA adenosine(34) deaminase TadA [Actinomycetota bacterium]